MGFTDLIGIQEGYQYEWVIVLFCLIALVLVLTVFILLARMVHKLSKIKGIGDRSQKECGVSYMECETSRYMLFQEYTKNKMEKRIESIKKLLYTALVLLVVSTIVLAVSSIVKKKNMAPNVIGLLLIVIVFLVFSGVNKDTILRKYNDKKDNSTKKLIAWMTVLLAFMVIFCVYKQLYENSGSGAVILLLATMVPVFAFMFMINISMNSIYFKFIKPYKQITTSTNNAIKNLVEDNRHTMPGGKKVGVWMKTTLAQNIIRVHPSEEYGEPRVILNGKSPDGIKYKDLYYAYLENMQGRELSELPNTRAVNEKRITIRTNMKMLREENKKMMKPVVRFIRIIQFTLLLVFLLLLFSFYHYGYMEHPMLTKFIILGLVVGMTLALMFSLII